MTAPFRKQLRGWIRLFQLGGELRSYVAPRRGRIALAATLALFSALFHMAEPWALQVVFDQAILNRPSSIPGFDPLAAVGGDRVALLGWAAVALVVLATLSGGLYYAQSLLVARVGQEIIRDLREDVFHHLLRLSLPFHRKHDAGDLLMRLTGDMVFLRDMILACLVTLTSELSILLLALTFMATVSWPLTIATAVVVPALVVLFRVFRRRMVETARKQRRREGKLARQVADVLIAIPMIQSFTAEGAEDDRFRRISKRSERAGLRSARLEAGMQRFVELAIAIGTAAVLWFGVREVLSGKMTPGVFLVFLAYLRMLWKPVRKLAKVTERTSRAAAATERVLEVLRASREIRDPKDAVPAPPLKGAIRFSRVSFSYEDGTTALADLSFEISPGEQVALVGPTGSGKSTLLSLLLRFHRPTAGRIYFDGEKAKNFTIASVRRQIAYLPQEPFLLAGSIRENLLYGKPEATDEEIWKALEAAGLANFVRTLRLGLDTAVAARGQSLSGGQKQRLAIARALLKDAPILLLDEPMTGLDARTERAVQESLERLRRGRTTITIAHRLSTVQSADRVLVLERGRLVANDGPSRLRDQPGLFRELLRSERSRQGASVPGIPGLCFDPALRGIERIQEEGGPIRFLKELARVAPVSGSASLHGVKQRLGKRAVVRAQSPPQGNYYVKFFRGRSGDWRLQTYRFLEESASAAGVNIPHLVGSLDRYRALVFCEISGEVLVLECAGTTSLHLRATARICAAAGAAIARFHTHAALPDRVAEADVECARLDQVAARVPSVFGLDWRQRWTRAADCWRRTHPESARSVSGAAIANASRVAIHGDFYPSQVLHCAGIGESAEATQSCEATQSAEAIPSIAILDWDALVAGEAERDLGNFVAHIDLARVRTRLRERTGTARQADGMDFWVSAGQAFLDGYASVRRYDEARFAWYRAGTLLRLARLYADPAFGPDPPNPPALAQTLLEEAEAEVQRLENLEMNAVPLNGPQECIETRHEGERRCLVPDPPIIPKKVGPIVVLAACAFGLAGFAPARAGFAPDSWGGFLAAAYESRPIDRSEAIDPAAGTGDSRYWFAEPEEWGGALRLWGKWKIRTAAGKTRVAAAYERKAWTKSDILARDLFELELRQSLRVSSDLELALEYTPQVYLRHRSDKDAPAGAPRFRPEAYAEIGGELAWLRQWGGFQSSLFGSYTQRDETKWFRERDRTKVGGGLKLQIPLGTTTQLRPAYEYEDADSRNEPDTGSDLSFREHTVGLRVVHDLAALGTALRLEGGSDWGFRKYTTSDRTDSSRYGRHDRILTSSARVLWLRGAWRPFASWERYSRSMDLSAAEADANDDESEKTLVRIGIELEL